MDRKFTAQLEKPPITTVSMEELKERLKIFEDRHGLSSEDFYTKAKAGLLDEQDDFIAWLGYYEAYLRLREKG